MRITLARLRQQIKDKADAATFAIAGLEIQENAKAIDIKPEVVPPQIVKLAETLEDGKVIIGGPRCGKTWAKKIASAKPAIKQLKP